MRPELGAELKRVAAERGETLVSIAAALGLYVNSLRSWMRRNTFPAEPLRKIARHLGFPDDLDQLRKHHEFELAGARRTPLMRLTSMDSEDQPSFEDGLRTLQSIGDSLVRYPARAASETRLMFKCLPTDGMYICSFLDVLPLELTAAGWAECGREVLKALRRGVSILYICPSPESLDRTGGGEAELAALSANVEQAIQRMKERVRNMADKASAEALAACIFSVRASAAWYQAHGHMWITLRGRTHVETRTQLFLRTTLAGDTMRHSTLLPLDAGITSQFMSFVLSEAEQMGDPHLLDRLFGAPQDMPDA